MKSSFIRRASKGREREEKKKEKKRDRERKENLNSKTLFYKNCSLGSVANLTTSPYYATDE